MIVGFTGTREGATFAQVETLQGLFPMLDVTQVHHGDCAGADAQFAEIANIMLRPDQVFVHPPINKECQAHTAVPGNIVMPEKDYYARDEDIVNACTLLIGCSKLDHETKSGTWYTINYAKKKKRPIIVIWPDGSFKVFSASKIPSVVMNKILAFIERRKGS